MSDKDSLFIVHYFRVFFFNSETFISTFFRQYRLMAYRQLCLYIHLGERLGKYNRRVMPSCAVREIRKRFPDEDGQYVDFKEVEDALEALQVN